MDIIGIIAALIGAVALVQTYRTEYKAQKLALFENRFSVYLEIENIMHESLQRYENSDLFSRIYRIKPKVIFLFGTDINDYLIEIIKALEVSNMDKDNWMINQIEEKILRGKFNRYLDLSSYGVKK